MLHINSLKSFTDREGFAKAFGLTVKEIPNFVLSNEHHVAEIYHLNRQVGTWTDTMGFAWELGSFFYDYTASAGADNSWSLNGCSSEEDFEYHLLRTEYTKAIITNRDNEVVGYWVRNIGFTWVEQNPYGPVVNVLTNKFWISNLLKEFSSQLAYSPTEPVEPTVSLDRQIERKVVETVEMVEASEEVKLAIAKVNYLKETNGSVDWKELTDDECWEYFNHMIQTNTQWLRRAVVAIFNHQTTDEQVAGQTKHRNGVGFNGLDAEIMTNIAQRIIANRRSLTEREVTAARKTMRKYVRQLVRIMRSS